MTHVANTTRMIDPALVRMFLDSQANKFVTVSFIKNDGTERTVNGQLKAASRLVGNARGAAQSAAMKSRGQVWIALPDGSSRSFYLDKVTRISAGKAVLEPRA
ncbi:hypothetical protein vBRpoSV10_230 [Ruegeria phage vB_RpoS-V10]|nr:hypothetical protein vBRpoSV10_230 [Ruegeria phage vB_RpoS-V10]